MKNFGIKQNRERVLSTTRSLYLNKNVLTGHIYRVRQLSLLYKEVQYILSIDSWRFTIPTYTFIYIVVYNVLELF